MLMLNDSANLLNDAATDGNEAIEIDERDLIQVSDFALLSQLSLADYDRSDARFIDRQAGKIGWALLWMMGIPLPVLLIIYLIRGH